MVLGSGAADALAGSAGVFADDFAAGFAGDFGDDFAAGFAGDCATLPRMAARMRASEAAISTFIRVSKASNCLVSKVSTSSVGASAFCPILLQVGKAVGAMDENNINTAMRKTERAT